MTDSSASRDTPPIGIFLMAHGAPNSVDDIPEYLRNIRSGTESSPEVIEIIRDRYQKIGGSSPLLDITQQQAGELEKFLNRGQQDFKVYLGMRNWSPYIRDAVKQMVNDGVKQVFALCLAPQYSRWSTELYFTALRKALAEQGAEDIELDCIASWANHPLFIDAIVGRYNAAIETLKQKGKDEVHTVFTVHSIPSESLEFGDPYADEYDRTLKLVVDRVKPHRWYKAYQSQGMIPVPWLGPTVESVLSKIARLGSKTVLIVPVGFVCDHIEILYDIDIGFKQFAEANRLDLHRTESMNLSPLFIEALAALVWERLV